MKSKKTCVIFQIMRQGPDDAMLITAINELATGDVSDETIAFLLSLTKHQTDYSSTSTHLCSLLDQLEIYNLIKLDQVKGKAQAYEADDFGERKLCDKLRVQKVHMLLLKFFLVFFYCFFLV